MARYLRLVIAPPETSSRAAISALVRIRRLGLSANVHLGRLRNAFPSRSVGSDTPQAFEHRLVQVRHAWIRGLPTGRGLMSHGLMDQFVS